MTVDTIGNTSGTDFFGSSRFRCSQITASASGSLSSVGINVLTPLGNITTALYSDNGGVPDLLLGTSAITAAASGWNDLAITGVTIVSGTPYWIGWNICAGGTVIYVQSGISSTTSQIVSCGAAPSPADTTAGAISEIANLRMTYTASATSTGNNWF